MCTIIGGKFKTVNVSADTYRIVIPGAVSMGGLKQMLDIKGGDYYSYKIFSDFKNLHEDDHKMHEVASGTSFEEFCEFLKATFTDHYARKYSFSFMFFSRLTPETEESEVKLTQPYKTINDKYILAHGTIPVKDETLVNIDTEIFRYDLDIITSLNKAETLNGKVSLIGYDPEFNLFTGLHNGLGIWTFKGIDLELITNISLPASSGQVKYFGPNESATLGSILDNSPSTYIGNGALPIQKRNRKTLLSLCSGGMDTILSTTYTLQKNNYDNIILMYFNWGTVAAVEEMNAIYEFKKYLVHELDYPDESIEVIIQPAQSYFTEVYRLAGIALSASRLCDENAEGKGHEEAEEAISYVPLRNTHLIMNAVAYLETYYPGEKADIVIGANLTEGMVYADNSANYIEKINALIKLAGQKTFGFSVVAPFMNDTKTRMLEKCGDKIGEKETVDLMRISFSCYFPKDGKPCEKCGSCLLKHKAIEKFTDSISKKRFETEECTQALVPFGVEYISSNPNLEEVKETKQINE